MDVITPKLVSDGIILKKEMGKMEMLWSQWVVDGLFGLLCLCIGCVPADGL